MSSRSMTPPSSTSFSRIIASIGSVKACSSTAHWPSSCTASNPVDALQTSIGKGISRSRVSAMHQPRTRSHSNDATCSTFAPDRASRLTSS